MQTRHIQVLKLDICQLFHYYGVSHLSGAALSLMPNWQQIRDLPVNNVYTLSNRIQEAFFDDRLCDNEAVLTCCVSSLTFPSLANAQVGAPGIQELLLGSP